jgi:hypothetical protein
VHDTVGTRADAPHAFIELEQSRRARYVRVTSGVMPFGGPFAVSGLRVFGLADGAKPSAVTPTAERTDELTATLAWESASGAVGYNVRYGTSPEKLYHSWLVYDRSKLVVGSLNAGVPYWFAVDSFNGAGVTQGAATGI